MSELQPALWCILTCIVGIPFVIGGTAFALYLGLDFGSYCADWLKDLCEALRFKKRWP